MFKRKTRKTYDFSDKKILITGGSRGIGLATTQAFLQHGAQVAICATRRTTLIDTKNRLSAFGQVMAEVVDVRDRQQVEHFVYEVQRRFGGIDILVNNAGILWVGNFCDQEHESIDALIDVNIKGVMYTTRTVLPYMIEKKCGVIVNISSGAGLTGFKQLVSYCTSKFAVVGFSQSLDQETRSKGIRVYALCPGRVATDMQVQYAGAKIGMPPEKVAEKILHLATLTGAIPSESVHSL